LPRKEAALVRIHTLPSWVAWRDEVIATSSSPYFEGNYKENYSGSRAPKYFRYSVKNIQRCKQQLASELQSQL
jgi:hypothetical protein